LKFMLEWTGPSPHYRPVGVWVEDGANVLVAFASKHDSAEDAREVMVRMKQVDVVPRDFLEHHLDGLPPQLGDRGPIFDTDRYKTVAECAEAVIGHIRGAWDNGKRRWTKDIVVLT